MYQGFLRLFLAFVVLYAHYFPNIANTGKYAVFSFYLVSGFLITSVINGRYSNGLKGLGAFALNRVLRIYPTYITSALFSLAVILYTPVVAVNISSYMRLPETMGEWIPQFLIFGSLTLEQEKLEFLFIPVGWSLNVELLYYIAIAVLAGRNFYICAVWWVISFLIGIYYGIYGDVDVDYFSYISPSICFATGGMMYFMRGWLNEQGHKIRNWDRAFAISLLVYGIYVFWPEPIGMYLYVFQDMPLSEVEQKLWIVDQFWIVFLITPITAIALFLSLAPSRPDRAVIARISSFCGDLSFPIFLLHWPVLVLITDLMGGAGGIGVTRERVYSILAVPVVIGLSALLVVCVERPLKAARAKVRALA